MARKKVFKFILMKCYFSCFIQNVLDFYFKRKNKLAHFTNKKALKEKFLVIFLFYSFKHDKAVPIKVFNSHFNSQIPDGISAK